MSVCTTISAAPFDGGHLGMSMTSSPLRHHHAAHFHQHKTAPPVSAAASDRGSGGPARGDGSSSANERWVALNKSTFLDILNAILAGGGSQYSPGGAVVKSTKDGTGYCYYSGSINPAATSPTSRNETAAQPATSQFLSPDVAPVDGSGSRRVDVSFTPEISRQVADVKPRNSDDRKSTKPSGFSGCAVDFSTKRSGDDDRQSFTELTTVSGNRDYKLYGDFWASRDEKKPTTCIKSAGSREPNAAFISTSGLPADYPESLGSFTAASYFIQRRSPVFSISAGNDPATTPRFVTSRRTQTGNELDHTARRGSLNFLGGGIGDGRDNNYFRKRVAGDADVCSSSDVWSLTSSQWKAVDKSLLYDVIDQVLRSGEDLSPPEFRRRTGNGNSDSWKRLPSAGFSRSTSGSSGKIERCERLPRDVAVTGNGGGDEILRSLLADSSPPAKPEVAAEGERRRARKRPHDPVRPFPVHDGARFGNSTEEEEGLVTTTVLDEEDDGDDDVDCYSDDYDCNRDFNNELQSDDLAAHQRGSLKWKSSMLLRMRATNGVQTSAAR